jgi:hypothetical protein
MAFRISIGLLIEAGRHADELGSSSREEAICEVRDFSPHGKFFQPLDGNAGSAVVGAGHLAANCRGSVSVIAEVGRLQDRRFKTICFVEAP